MNKHLFSVGQTVSVLPSADRAVRAADIPGTIDPSVQIVRLLPAADLCFRYLVRNTTSGLERILGESELRGIAKACAVAR